MGRGVCGFSEVSLELYSWYIPKYIIVQNWLSLALSWLHPPHCTLRKHWNSNRICPSLNIWIQVETFMGNYINILVSWVPSKYHKSGYSRLDKIHFRAVVRKVNYKILLQSLCFFLVKRPVLYFTLFCSGFSLSGEGIAAYCLYIIPETCSIGLNQECKALKKE